MLHIYVTMTTQQKERIVLSLPVQTVKKLREIPARKRSDFVTKSIEEKLKKAERDTAFKLFFSDREKMKGSDTMEKIVEDIRAFRYAE